MKEHLDLQGRVTAADFRGPGVKRIYVSRHPDRYLFYVPPLELLHVAGIVQLASHDGYPTCMRE